MPQTEQKSREAHLINEISDMLLDAYDLRVKDLNSSIDLANKALRLSKQINHQGYIAKSYTQLSLFQMIIGEYDESTRLAQLAISIYTDLGDDRGTADAMYNVASVYYKTNKFHSGLIYLVDCLAIYKKYHDYHNQARVLKSMGTIYEYFGDTTTAVNSYLDAVEAGKMAGDKNLQSNAYNPLSGIYLNRNQVQKAMETILTSLQMKEETGDLRGMAFAIYGRAKVHVEMSQFEDAEKDYLKSLQIHTEMGEKLGRGMTLNKLGAMYLKMGAIKQAKERIMEALNFSIESQTAFIKYKAYQHLYQIAKAENNDKEALLYLEKYINEKEHVINPQTQKIIEAYQVISEKQNLELEAKTQKEKADIIETKNKELDSFFYKVSHDLKSPITSIIGLDAIVREKVTDKTALKYFEVYRKQVLRANNILDDLMKLAKVDHSSGVKMAINFRQTIDDCIHSLSFKENHADISFRTSVAEEISYSAEPTLINSIIQNLMENAVKYADLKKEDPFVQMDVSIDDTHVTIVAQDNGIGMTQRTLDRMFEMFFRAQNQSQGSGLGLYIMQRAVEKLRGTTDVSSDLSIGTKVTVKLPLTPN